MSIIDNTDSLKLAIWDVSTHTFVEHINVIEHDC